MRAAYLLTLLTLAMGTVLAQTSLPGTPDAAEQPRERAPQRIERIHHEDAGSTVDEVRHGGQTQSITVQPKTNVPPYEVLPADGPRSGTPSRDSAPGAAGQRVWNLRKF